MAVTRTRTRTQSALTKIAELIAEAHGELRVLAELEEQVQQGMAGDGDGRRRKKCRPAPETVLAGIAARRADVERTRDALYVTLRQFDPTLDPRRVGESFVWLREFGRGSAAARRYRRTLADVQI
jgi:hypothetical protein